MRWDFYNLRPYLDVSLTTYSKFHTISKTTPNKPQLPLVSSFLSSYTSIMTRKDISCHHLHCILWHFDTLSKFTKSRTLVPNSLPELSRFPTMLLLFNFGRVLHSILDHRFIHSLPLTIYYLIPSAPQIFSSSHPHNFAPITSLGISLVTILNLHGVIGASPISLSSSSYFPEWSDSSFFGIPHLSPYSFCFWDSVMSSDLYHRFTTSQFKINIILSYSH